MNAVPTDVSPIEQLDDDALLELTRRTSPGGILSVYVSADPSDPGLQAAGIDLKNRLAELRQNLSDRRDVAAAIDRLDPELELLVSPRGTGRGRILFASVEGDWMLRLDSALPVPPRVVLDDDPFIHPLLELLDSGRAAGVVLASGESGRVLEWRMGRLRELSRLEAVQPEAPHERSGHVGGGPAGQYNSPVREQRKARERKHAQRFHDEVADVVAGLSAERGWVKVLVSGGDRWTEPVVGALPTPLAEAAVRDTRVLDGLDDNGLADAVNEVLGAERSDRRAMLTALVAEARNDRRLALGLSEVTAALNAGRVSHLVYDPGTRYTGSVTAEGTLLADDERAPGSDHSPDTRLTERLVERALATGARVSPAEGAAQDVLPDAAGIAARLRW